MSGPIILPTQAPAPCSPDATSCPPPDGKMPSIKPESPFGDKGSGLDHLLPHFSGSTSGLTHAIVIVAACALTAAVLVVIMSTVASRLAWSPARARNWAIGSLVAIPGSEIVFSGFDFGAPIRVFDSGATAFLSGNTFSGLLSMSVLIVPAAWLIATLFHADRLVTAMTKGFRSTERTERFRDALKDRQQAAARRMARYPVPLTTGGLNPNPVLGRVAVHETAAPPRSRLQVLLPRHRSLLTLPWVATRQHLVTVANSGSGKTTLLVRTMVSWYVSTWFRHRQWWRYPRTGRPLAWLVDCNGGHESKKLAQLLARWARRLGAERVAIFPEYTKFNLWDMPRDDMRAVLSAMISGGAQTTTATEKYFMEIRETLIHLIVDAPMVVKNGLPEGENPPRSSEEFLARFDPEILAMLWGGTWDEDKVWTGVRGVDAEIGATVNTEEPVMTSARAEFGNLFRSLGDAFEGDARIEDFDWIVCILEGTTQPERARAQYGALGAMAEQLANREHGRETLWATDEFSAIADKRTRADKWVQRMRKAKIGTWFVAQDWTGLGADDEQRQSLVSAGAGGGLHGRQENGSKLASIYMKRRAFSVMGRLRGRQHTGNDSSIQATDVPLLDANRLAGLDVGDIVYIRGRNAIFGHVTELTDEDFEKARPLPGLNRFAPAGGNKSLAKVIDLKPRRSAD